MNQQLRERRAALLDLTKTDPDPAVRHRAHVLLVSLDRGTKRAAVEACGVSVRSITRWWARLLVTGRDGLADRPRQGRPATPPRRRATCCGPRSPDAYGYPVTVWTIADLTDLLAQ